MYSEQQILSSEILEELKRCKKAIDELYKSDNESKIFFGLKIDHLKYILEIKASRSFIDVDYELEDFFKDIKNMPDSVKSQLKKLSELPHERLISEIQKDREILNDETIDAVTFNRLKLLINDKKRDDNKYFNVVKDAIDPAFKEFQSRYNVVSTTGFAVASFLGLDYSQYSSHQRIATEVIREIENGNIKTGQEAFTRLKKDGSGWTDQSFLKYVIEKMILKLAPDADMSKFNGKMAKKLYELVCITNQEQNKESNQIPNSPSASSSSSDSSFTNLPKTPPTTPLCATRNDNRKNIVSETVEEDKKTINHCKFQNDNLEYFASKLRRAMRGGANSVTSYVRFGFNADDYYSERNKSANDDKSDKYEMYEMDDVIVSIIMNSFNNNTNDAKDFLSKISQLIHSSIFNKLNECYYNIRQGAQVNRLDAARECLNEYLPEMKKVINNPVSLEPPKSIYRFDNEQRVFNLTPERD